MRRPRFASLVRLRVSTVLALSVVAGCTDVAAPGVSSTSSPIFGGTLDTTHGAVMALINQVSATNTAACSGTVIAMSGAEGVFLTAGHCVVANDGQGNVSVPVTLTPPGHVFVVPGPDWQASVKNGLYYGVTEVSVPPQYDGSVQNPYDLALVRFVGALPSTPVIPALAPTDDKLAVGSGITVVGFGKTDTETATMMNTQRRQVTRVVQSITASQFLYDQTDLKGACEGDSGGPALVDTAAGPRVAGVTSFGDPDCTRNGASVRVSPLFTCYVQAFIAALPRTLSCDDCALASVAPGNACVNQSTACGAATSDCRAYLDCADACTTNACASGCQSTHRTGANAYAAIVACQCGGACTAACASDPVCGGAGGAGATSPTGGTSRAFGASCGGGSGGPGNVGPGSGGPGTIGSTGAAGGSGNFACTDFTDPRMGCQTCIQGSCCNQAIGCAGDTTCTSCRIDASSPACHSNAAFTALSQCLANCSGSPCSAATGAAGTAGPAAPASSGCSYARVGGSPGAGLSCGALLALAIVASRSRRRR